MPRPLVVTSSSVRDLLRGESLGQYLGLLGSPSQIDTKIETAILNAQSEVERDCQTHLTRRVIRTRPAGNKEDGSPYVKGVDYDYEEPAYTYFPEDWETGFAEIRLKRAPIYSIESVAIRYGQSQTQPVLLIPDQWNVPDHNTGILNIQPLVGVGAATAAGLVLLPILGQGIMSNKTPISCIVTVNYTAGYLPKEFDPETDDPYEANPDQDVTLLLQAVRELAAAQMLDKLSIASDGDSGSLSVDGASESITPGRFDKARDSLRAQGRKTIEDHIAATQLPNIGWI